MENEWDRRPPVQLPLCYIHRPAVPGQRMIEIQVHPSDIRRRVRYFFFDRRRVTVGIIALTLVLGGLIGSMAAAPTVIRRVYKDNFVKTMREEREIQRERLHEN